MFRRKTLDEILGGFQDLKVELLDHVTHHSNEIGRKREEVALLKNQIDQHDVSVNRANRVIENINNLVGETP